MNAKKSKKSPKKSLGQHWLKSEKALSQIIDAANPIADDIILEIGPGEGVLTERLAFFAGKVIAVEKDRELIPQLKERFTSYIEKGRLEIIEQDILDFNPEVLRFYEDFSYKVVANIPYYITGAIIEKFLSAQYQPESMVLLIQKEVAERIVAKDGKESIYSIAVKAYGTPKIIAKVPAGAFNPPPKVDSSILYIYDISRDCFKNIDEALFFKVLKAVFGKKRKQIVGSLAEFLQNKDHAATVLTEAGIDPKARPETLPLGAWQRLAQILQQKK